MRNIRLVIILLLILTTSLNMSCWDSRDIEELALVVAIGIDLGEQPDTYNVTFQVARPDLIGQGQESGGGTNAVWVTTTTGNSLFEAINNARKYFPRQIFFGYTQLLVFGEELAQTGVGPLLDFAQREINLRRSIWIAVAKGEAKTIMETKPQLAQIPAIGLVSLFGLQQHFTLAYTMRFGDFVADIGTPYTGATAPLVEVVKSVPDETVPMEDETNDTAVFKGDRLTGWLNNRETIGLLWLQGKAEDASLQIRDPLDERYLVNIDIVRARVNTKVEIIDDKIVYQVQGLTEGRFASQTAPHDLSSPERIKLVEKHMATAIENKMRDTFKKAQELGVDFIGVGHLMSKDQPKKWKEIEQQWEDFFQEVVIDVEAVAHLRRTGAITQPTKYK
ncbi:MAG: Ger(x)C family spore germination protein [Bacillota bacterium]|nr:Ger(x)C family spore germination protein [Bacillota bacterium]